MNGPQRYIAHFDLDSFFVSVEVLNDPSLKGKPVIVGGSRERGVVTSCSYEARKFGVHSAMPMNRAMKLCPHAIVVRGTRGEYSRYSRWVTDIIAAKAPLFEKASIDEFYLDLTGMDRFFDPYQWTIDLRSEIIEKTQLPISFGLATNKMIAKIATDEAKPNGYLFVQPGMEKQFLAPLPVNKFPGVGEHTFLTLKSMGIHTIRDLANTPVAMLEKKLGKYGADLWQKSQGRHFGEVHAYHEAKSISTENTFEENITDEERLLSELVRMTEKVAFELRQDEKLTGCIAVKVRYPDFETTSRQTTIDYTLRDDELIPVAIDLFHKLYRKGQPVRLLGVRLSELTQHPVQASLFDDAEKKNKLYKAIDDVKNTFGKTSLKKARTLGSGKRADK
ncbi:MAG: DNA polymerase IV [Chitinophagaceae bacterium]|nr:DNA polymerase IV [Chitinophagaceae bacterium]MEA3425784.1 DNA polymerase IV [Bacteroidota bacterium]MCA6451709.1 DNA polymerase IV [Chitinophagaceae bacterium]MCA6456502.1 DNA polymerase IV [Chitinophagaceae bacterium]MCA6459816.1 DNA polymerase IV [Chitinophagaceae bacterium]